MTSHKEEQPKNIDRFLRNAQEQFMFMRQCLLCKKHYHTEEHIRVLYTHDPMYLIHITCPECGNAMLTIVTLSQLGMSSIGLYTDLTLEDAEHFQEAPPLSEDDILKMHEVVSKGDAFLSL